MAKLPSQFAGRETRTRTSGEFRRRQTLEFQRLSPLSHDFYFVISILWFVYNNAQETGQKRFSMVIISKNR
jgi:hypothetical protein